MAALVGAKWTGAKPTVRSVQPGAPDPPESRDHWRVGEGFRKDFLLLDVRHNTYAVLMRIYKHVETVVFAFPQHGNHIVQVFGIIDAPGMLVNSGVSLNQCRTR
jgi:hypothetical protein